MLTHGAWAPLLARAGHTPLKDGRPASSTPSASPASSLSLPAPAPGSGPVPPCLDGGAGDAGPAPSPPQSAVGSGARPALAAAPWRRCVGGWGVASCGPGIAPATLRPRTCRSLPKSGHIRPKTPTPGRIRVEFGRDVCRAPRTPECRIVACRAPEHLRARRVLSSLGPRFVRACSARPEMYTERRLLCGTACMRAASPIATSVSELPWLLEGRLSEFVSLRRAARCALKPVLQARAQHPDS